MSARFTSQHLAPPPDPLGRVPRASGTSAPFTLPAPPPLYLSLPPTSQARAEGLWNLWLPAHLAAGLRHLVDGSAEEAVQAGAVRAGAEAEERASLLGPGLNNLEYAHLCEITGR